MNPMFMHAESGLPAVVFDGCPRLLGKLPADPAGRARLRRFADVAPLVPESEWREIDRRAALPFVSDQRSHGSCVGFASAGALARARALGGAAAVALSGAFVYAQINGGRDAGAIITDALAVLRDRGTCPEELCGWDQIFPRQIPPEAVAAARRFRLLEAYTADTWAEIMSALQLGFVPVFAVMVGSTFQEIDGNGVAGYDRGPGNHAVHADGCRRAGGGWQLDMVNSWGPRFGQAGRCFLTRRHVEGVEQDCYVIRAAAEDPQEPNRPPAVV